MTLSETISFLPTIGISGGGSMKRFTMRRPGMALTAGLFTALLFLSGCASTAPRKTSAADVETKKAALDLFVEGKTEEAKGNRDGAIALYFEAFQYNPKSDDIAIALSKAFISSGKIKSSLLFANSAVSINPSNAEGWKILQFLYQQEGDIAKAASSLEMLMKLEPDPDIGMIYRLAQYYFALQKDSRAREILLTRVKQSNVSRDELTGIAGFLADNGLFGDAASILRNLVYTDPTDVDSWVNLGTLYSELGQEQNASETYAEALEKNPGNVSIFISIGNSCMRENNWNCAIEYFERARANGFNNPKIMSTLTALYFNSEKFNEAEALRDSIIALGEDGAPFYFSLGKSMNYLERYHDAAEYFRKGFENPVDTIQDNDKLNAYVGYMRALIQIDKGDEALRIIREEASKIIRDEESLKDIEAIVYMEMKRYDDAAAIYEWLLDASPDNPRYILSLTQAYNANGLYSKSEEKLLAALGKEPDNTRYLMQLGIVYDMEKNFKKAEDVFLRIIELEPNNSLALNNLSYMYIENGKNISKAIRMVKQALKVEPQNGAYLDTLGWGYFRKGDLAAARENIENALKYSEKSDRGVIYDHYGDVLVKQGENEKAREAYMKAVEFGEAREKIQKKIDDLD